MNSEYFVSNTCVYFCPKCEQLTIGGNRLDKTYYCPDCLVQKLLEKGYTINHTTNILAQTIVWRNGGGWIQPLNFRGSLRPRDRIGIDSTPIIENLSPDPKSWGNAQLQSGQIVHMDLIEYANGYKPLNVRKISIMAQTTTLNPISTTSNQSATRSNPTTPSISNPCANKSTFIAPPPPPPSSPSTSSIKSRSLSPSTSLTLNEPESNKFKICVRVRCKQQQKLNTFYKIYARQEFKDIMNAWFVKKSPTGIKRDKLVWKYNNLMIIKPDHTPASLPLLINETITNNYNLPQDTIDVVF